MLSERIGPVSSMKFGARLNVKFEDANGNPLPGHFLSKLNLAQSAGNAINYQYRDRVKASTVIPISEDMLAIVTQKRSTREFIQSYRKGQKAYRNAEDLPSRIVMFTDEGDQLDCQKLDEALKGKGSALKKTLNTVRLVANIPSDAPSLVIRFQRRLQDVFSGRVMQSQHHGLLAEKVASDIYQARRDTDEPMPVTFAHESARFVPITPKQFEELKTAFTTENGPQKQNEVLN